MVSKAHKRKMHGEGRSVPRPSERRYKVGAPTCIATDACNGRAWRFQTNCLINEDSADEDSADENRAEELIGERTTVERARADRAHWVD